MKTIIGYELTEKLYESGTSLIFRTRKREGQHPTILKILKQDGCCWYFTAEIGPGNR